MAGAKYPLAHSAKGHESLVPQSETDGNVLAGGMQGQPWGFAVFPTSGSSWEQANCVLADPEELAYRPFLNGRLPPWDNIAKFIQILEDYAVFVDADGVEDFIHVAQERKEPLSRLSTLATAIFKMKRSLPSLDPFWIHSPIIRSFLVTYLPQDLGRHVRVLDGISKRDFAFPIVQFERKGTNVISGFNDDRKDYQKHVDRFVQRKPVNEVDYSVRQKPNPYQQGHPLSGPVEVDLVQNDRVLTGGSGKPAQASDDDRWRQNKAVSLYHKPVSRNHPPMLESHELPNAMRPLFAAGDLRSDFWKAIRSQQISVDRNGEIWFASSSGHSVRVHFELHEMSVRFDLLRTGVHPDPGSYLRVQFDANLYDEDVQALMHQCAVKPDGESGKRK